MKNLQSYQDLVEKVTMYLDNELSQDEKRKFLQELQASPEHVKILSKERSFREFIKSRVHRRTVSPMLIQSIKEEIQLQTPVPAE